MEISDEICCVKSAVRNAKKQEAEEQPHFAGIDLWRGKVRPLVLTECKKQFACELSQFLPLGSHSLLAVLRWIRRGLYASKALG